MSTVPHFIRRETQSANSAGCTTLAFRMPSIIWIGMPTYILVFAIGGMVVALLAFLIAFFHPGLEYRTAGSAHVPIGTAEFARIVALLTDSESHPDTHIEV